MKDASQLVFNTSRNPMSLARAIASRPKRVDQMTGPDAARTLMVCQLPVLPTVYPKHPSGKPNIAARRRAKLEMKRKMAEVAWHGEIDPNSAGVHG